MTYLWCILSALAAAVIAALSTERRGRTNLQNARTAEALAQQRAESSVKQNSALQNETTGLREQASAAQRREAAAQAQLQSAQENLASQKQLLDDAQKKLTESFALASREALEKNSAAFLQMAQARFATLSTEAAGTLETRKAQIEALLKPMQELLTGYQQRLAEIEKSRLESYGQLRQQIGSLAQTETNLAAQTGQLISALTRPSVRGQWGEITLRRLVEMAGLSAHCDYVEQPSVNVESAEPGSTAARLRPDMVVRLPLDRSIVIDAKAVLGAFLDAAAALDETARQAHLARHAQLVRARAKDLAGKNYWAQFANSPEFVVLFLPGESFLYAAVEQEPGLIEECLAAKVILATPTTLIALLKTVEYGWRQESMSQNAQQIRDLGAEIYDRLATLVGHIAKLGASLDGAVGNYNNAVRNLESRLLVSARRMGELGVTHTKDLPDDLPQIETRAQQLASLQKPAKAALFGE